MCFIDLKGGAMNRVTLRQLGHALVDVSLVRAQKTGGPAQRSSDEEIGPT